MNAFKRYFGLLFLLIAPLIIYELILGAIANIDTAGKKDINNPVIWIIIIAIFTPIAIGLIQIQRVVNQRQKILQSSNNWFLQMLLSFLILHRSEKNSSHITFYFRPGSGWACC